MSIQQEQDEVELRISAQDVEEYLHRHPEYFETHIKLLSELKVPHVTGGAAVSLVERQVHLLRQQNKKLQKQLNDLLAIARENDKLSKQVFKLTLNLMDAGNLADAIRAVKESLRRDFNADAISIRLLEVPTRDNSVDWSEFVVKPEVLNRLFEKNLKEGRPVCGRFKEVQRKYLFGNYADRIESLALLPLVSATGSFGLLAIGSYLEYRFHSGKGTVYLTQMSNIISKTFMRCVGSEKI